MNRMNTFRLLAVLALSRCPTVFNAQAQDYDAKEALVAAEAWLGHIDSGNYADSWRETSAYVRGAVTEYAFIESLNRVRKPFGRVVSRRLKSAHQTRFLPGAPDDNYVVMQFETSFDRKGAATETVTFLQEEDGTWKAAGFYIK